MEITGKGYDNKGTWVWKQDLIPRVICSPMLAAKYKNKYMNIYFRHSIDEMYIEMHGHSFINCISMCDNFLISTIVTSMHYMNSAMFHYWNKICICDGWDIYPMYIMYIYTLIL